MSKVNNLFIDGRQIKILDTYRLIYFAIFVFSFFVTELGRNVYRPYIYSHHINDYGLADAIGNLGGIVVQIFFILAILNPPKRKAYNVIAFLSLGYILYEIAQPYLPKGVFDWKDIWGTLIGGVFSLFLFLIIQSMVKNKVIKKFQK
jgi:hypothetical protein